MSASDAHAEMVAALEGLRESAMDIMQVFEVVEETARGIKQMMGSNGWSRVVAERVAAEWMLKTFVQDMTS